MASSRADSAGICHVCGNDYDGSHSCIICRRKVHLLCGKPVEEGYGCPVRCNTCLQAGPSTPIDHSACYEFTPGDVRRKITSSNLEKTPVKSCNLFDYFTKGKERSEKSGLRVEGAEPVAKKIRRCQPHINGNDQPATKGRKRKQQIDTHYCLRCRSTICRGNESTRLRHKTNKHANDRTYDINKEILRIDHERVVKQLKAKASVADDCHNIGAASTQDNEIDALPPSSQTINIVPVSQNSSITANSPQEKEARIQSTLPFHITSDSTIHNAESINSLSNKIEKLTETVQKLVNAMQINSNPKNTFEIMGEFPNSENDKKIHALRDAKSLSDIKGTGFIFKEVEGDDGVNAGGLITCTICHSYVTSTNKKTKRSFAWGMFYDAEKVSEFVRGGNKHWSNLKHLMLQHLKCLSPSSAELSGGMQHYYGLLHQKDAEANRSSSLKTVGNLIRAAMNVVKSKSAATHYENSVGLLSSAGAVVGSISHGRLQFNEIISAINIFIKLKTRELLRDVLPSTGLPRHFATASDKSTPTRMTNQAIMFLTMIKGEKSAVPLSAPPVYEEGDDGEVIGGSAGELAQQIVDALTVNLKMERSVLSRLVSHQADGQYATGAFRNSLVEAVESEKQHIHAHNKYFLIIWDAAHMLDLCLKKIGKRKDLMMHGFLNRSNKFANMFGNGKGMSQYQVTARFLGLTGNVIPNFSTTRMTSSSFAQFENIYKSYEALIRTFSKTRETADDCEEMKYAVRGRDFAIDLCGVLDTFSNVIEMMVRVQSIENNIWDTARMWRRLQKIISDRIAELKILNARTTPDRELFPMLHLHWDKLSKEDVKHCEFKGVELLEGWLVKEIPSESGEKAIPWEARMPMDCIADLCALNEQIMSAIDERFNKVLPPAAFHLATSFEPRKTIELLAEKSFSARLTAADRAALQVVGATEFHDFYSYVCSLGHVKDLAAEKPHLNLNSQLSKTVLFKFRHCFHAVLFKDFGNCRNQWFTPTDTNAKIPIGVEMDGIEIIEGKSELQCHYILKFEQKRIKCGFNTSLYYKTFYENELVYSEVGMEYCIALDVALNLGGSEAVVESFYSVMESQTQLGPQFNSTLVERTNVDWLFPNVIVCPRTIEKVAKLYIDGNREFGLSGHRLPIFKDERERYKQYKMGSKVLDRLYFEDPKRASFVLENEN